MFKKRAPAERNAAIRDHELRTMEQGRTRLISREVIGSLISWAILTPALYLFGNHSHSYVRSMIFADLFVLPIFVLGGYLTGRWKWIDLEKKYPER
jgi:hypothetical protein